MKRLLFCFILLGICLTANASQNASDAVALIWVNGRSLGTGFFISQYGQLLTAYHVIKDAQKIRILHQGNSTSDVIVEKYSPEHDLAILRVAGLPQPTPYLEMVTTLPEKISDEELYVFGHAAGLPDQRLIARMTTRSTRTSQQIRGPNLERIFALDNVQLIPLQVTLYNGISGGPVVSSHGVIGVLSGSLNEGGTIAWAIPGMYARPEVMEDVNRRPDEIGTWPAISLMSSGWRNLRKAVNISPEIANTLEACLTAVDNLVKSTKQLYHAAGQAQNELSGIGREVDAGNLSEARKRWERLGPFYSAVDDYGKALREVSVELLFLTRKIVSLDLPNTQNNMKVKAELSRDFAAAVRVFSESQASGRAEEDNISTKLDELVASDVWTLDDLRRAVSLTERAIENEANASALDRMAARVQVAQDLLAAIKKLLTSGLETADMNWTYRSELGYEISFPSRWVIAPHNEDRKTIIADTEPNCVVDEVFYHLLPDGQGDMLLIARTRSKAQVTIEEITADLESLKINGEVTPETIAGTDVLRLQASAGEICEIVYYFPSSHLRLQLRFRGGSGRKLIVEQQALRIAESMRLR